MNLGQAIRQLRKQKSLTLSELAEQTGSYVGNLSRIERDLANPSLELLYRIASALGYSVADIFLATGDHQTRQDTSQVALNAIFVSLLQKDRELLLDIARLMEQRASHPDAPAASEGSQTDI